MGVWMEDESTVMTVSQGISRPNGANTALNFLAGGMPAELSANKLMGASVGGLVRGHHWQRRWVCKSQVDDDDGDDGFVGSGLGGGG